MVCSNEGSCQCFWRVVGGRIEEPCDLVDKVGGKADDSEERCKSGEEFNGEGGCEWRSEILRLSSWELEVATTWQLLRLLRWWRWALDGIMVVDKISFTLLLWITNVGSHDHQLVSSASIAPSIVIEQLQADTASLWADACLPWQQFVLFSFLYYTVAHWSHLMQLEHQCPYCLRTFTTAQGITHHLSQPLRACCSWQDDLIAVVEVLEKEQERTPASPNVTSEMLMEVDAMFNPDFSCQVDDVMDGEEDIPLPGTKDIHMMVDDLMESHQQEYFSTVEYDGAVQVFDVGETFLNHFEMNCYSFQCKKNIYYPFMNQKEWNLAKYLLCSLLSMADIDELLKLKVVCVQLSWGLVFYCLRLRISVFCFVPPKNCMVMLRCFPSAQSGNTALYQLNSQLHCPRLFTSAIPSIALSCFSIIPTFRTKLISLHNTSIGLQRMWLNVCTVNGLLDMQLGICRYVMFRMWHLPTDFIWGHSYLLAWCFLMSFSLPIKQTSHPWWAVMLPILSSLALQMSVGNKHSNV